MYPCFCVIYVSKVKSFSFKALIYTQSRLSLTPGVLENKLSFPHQEGHKTIIETKWANVSLIKYYCFSKKVHRISSPHCANRTISSCISIRSAPQCVSNSWAMWTPDGVFLLPFEMMHQQENINKCLPPSTFNPPSSSSSFHHPPSPPPSAESHSLTCEALPGRQEHVFGIKLLNALSNKIYSLIGSFPIYILPFLFWGWARQVPDGRVQWR